MTINRYYEMILSDIDFRMLVKYIDLNDYDCMYQAIGVDTEKYPEFEDDDIDMLYRLFISEERLDDLLEDLKIGKKATVKVYTLCFKTFEGEVVEIMPEKSNLIPVKIKISNNAKNCNIKTNAKAFVKIKVK